MSAHTLAYTLEHRAQHGASKNYLAMILARQQDIWGGGDPLVHLSVVS